MNPILQALSSGHSVKKILDYLSKSSPELASKITQAIAYGYPASEVLKYVMNGGKNVSKQLPNASSEDNNLYTKMQYSLPENMKEAGNFALNASKLAAGATIASKLYSGLQGAAGSTSAPSAGPPTPSPTSPNMTAGALPDLQPSAPIQPGSGIPQQVQQQAQSPVINAKSPSQPAQVAQASQANITPEEKPGSIFDKLTEGVDQTSLDLEQQQQLKFLNLISDQLQSQGRDLNDPEFKKLSEKIKSVVRRKPGTVVRESARFNEGYPQPSKEESKLELTQKEEKRVDPDVQYKDFFKGKNKADVDAFANEKLNTAFSEIEKGLASGETYGVFHGDEWQSVGNKDVNEGSPNAPNEPKRHIGSGKKLIQVIEDHVPIQGLYRYYFDTAEKRKRMPFNKFSRGYEKAVEEMIVKKTNPELYSKHQAQEKEFLSAITKDEVPQSNLFEEMEKVIEEVLFKQYDDDFENYLTKMINKIK